MFNKINFALGLSKPLNIFNKRNEKLINFVIKHKLFIHTSISYPMVSETLRLKTNQKKIENLKFITKICADNLLNFDKTFNLTLKNFALKKINIIQLINLPIKTSSSRKFNELDLNEFGKIIKKIYFLKKKGLVNKSYIQIYYNDELKLIKKIVDKFDGVVFYANPKKIHIKKKVYSFIIKNNIPCILLSIFGKPKKKLDLKHNLNSFIFSQTNFSKNTIAVGSTTKIERLSQILKFNKTYRKKNNFSKLSFKSNGIIQEDSKVFFKHYKISNHYKVIKFLFVCFLKKILFIK